MILNQFQNIISYVPQDIYLIDSDIKENVSLEESENLNNHKLRILKKLSKKLSFFLTMKSLMKNFYP